MSLGPCPIPILGEICVTGPAPGPPPTTATAGASPSQSPPPNEPTITITGVYLFIIPTLLAVLVAAGLAVIARIVLQRRRRRQLEEAIAAGMLLPEQLVALGYGPYVVEQAVPIMWEASLDKKGDGGEDLKTVLPLSATVIPDQSSSSPTVNSPHMLGRMFRRLFPRNRSSTSSPPPSDTTMPDHLQVTFLVSLPTPPEDSNANDQRKGELGEVAFGTVEFPWNDSRRNETS